MRLKKYACDKQYLHITLLRTKINYGHFIYDKLPIHELFQLYNKIYYWYQDSYRHLEG